MSGSENLTKLGKSHDAFIRVELVCLTEHPTASWSLLGPLKPDSLLHYPHLSPQSNLSLLQGRNYQHCFWNINKKAFPKTPSLMAIFFYIYIYLFWFCFWHKMFLKILSLNTISILVQEGFKCGRDGVLVCGVISILSGNTPIKPGETERGEARI